MHELACGRSFGACNPRNETENSPTPGLARTKWGGVDLLPGSDIARIIRGLELRPDLLGTESQATFCAVFWASWAMSLPYAIRISPGFLDTLNAKGVIGEEGVGSRFFPQVG